MFKNAMRKLGTNNRALAVAKAGPASVVLCQSSFALGIALLGGILRATTKGRSEFVESFNPYARDLS
jgi:hypothetical protein